MNLVQMVIASVIAGLVVYLVTIRNEPKWGAATAVGSALAWWLISHLLA